MRTRPNYATSPGCGVTATAQLVPDASNDRIERKGGKGGIRTHGGDKPRSGFRDRPIRPLWHLPKREYSTDSAFWQRLPPAAGSHRQRLSLAPTGYFRQVHPAGKSPGIQAAPDRALSTYHSSNRGQLNSMSGWKQLGYGEANGWPAYGELAQPQVGNLGQGAVYHSTLCTAMTPCSVASLKMAGRA